jgi:hypothetical protein
VRREGKFAEAQGLGYGLLRTSTNISESVVPSTLASLSAWTMEGGLPASRQEVVLSMSGSLCIALSGRRHVAR